MTTADRGDKGVKEQSNIMIGVDEKYLPDVNAKFSLGESIWDILDGKIDKFLEVSLTL